MGCSRLQSSFEAVWKARKLAGLVHDDNFLPVYASANIKILPYQIAAARFALRSGNLKGCILCDEGSLGKTYEALLFIRQIIIFFTNFKQKSVYFLIFSV